MSGYHYYREKENVYLLHDEIEKDISLLRILKI